MTDNEVPVLIVGGSLVGMTAACLLGHHGIPSLVVERHRGSAIHPRAALILQRSMEIYRGIGLEENIEARSREQFDQDAAIMSVESLAGEEIAWHLPRLNDGVRDLSPSERLFASQIAIEPVLGERARELGAETRFGTELVGFEQDDDGVVAVVRDRDTDEQSSVRARYMVASDGARSRVREQLGIGQAGRGAFSNSVTIYFHADVKPLMRGRNLGVIMVVNDTLQGFFRIQKPYESGFLAVHGLGDPKRPNSDVSQNLTEERCVELVRAALGVPDLPVTIDDVMHWQARADVSDSYRKGRVFLVGDAAHVMPPYGGYGGNTGIHDAHNLAWKLAAVINGSADPELLSTYEVERKPVAQFTVEQAYARYVTRAAPFLATKGVEKLVDDAHIDLGYRYRSSAVISGSNGDFLIQSDPRETAGLPGTRAPHQLIARDGQECSILDLFGRNAVLLTGSSGTRWSIPARRISRKLGIRLDLHVIGGAETGRDVGEQFTALYGITESGAVLVRPDGFVCWRAQTDNDASDQPIESALQSLLGRTLKPAVL
ncbi:FAD-dependent monooxygenase [Rhodococcus sp. NPDC059968]|uniref:FAD-dependent monooxygenase n=1 Tax=Rhodococcus sp. NPDC059968 TaxID=3347017 RepID=UPI00366E53C0